MKNATRASFIAALFIATVLGSGSLLALNGERAGVRGEVTKQRRVIVEILFIRFRTLYSGAFSALTMSRFFKVRSTTSADSVEAVATTAIAKV